MVLLIRVAVALLTVAAATFITFAAGFVMIGLSKESSPMVLGASVAMGVAWGSLLAVRNWGHEWGRPRA